MRQLLKSTVSISENLVIETVLKYTFRHHFYFILSWYSSKSIENRREYVFFGNDDHDDDDDNNHSDFPDCLRTTDVTSNTQQKLNEHTYNEWMNKRK